jgi:hypothetical protein
MQTALQELIERLNHVREFDRIIPGLIKQAEGLLEKEKEQIKRAYTDGHMYQLDTEEYYNQTYNQNK